MNSISIGQFNSRNIATIIKSVVSIEALTGFARRIKAHKEMQKLHRLDDNMLKDIGLYRSDLDWAMQQSQRIEPLKALQERRDETLRGEHLANVQSYCKTVRRGVAPGETG